MTEKPGYNDERAAILALLARGEITLAEAAQLASASRQLTRYWVQHAGVDWKRVRNARITKAFQKEMGRR